MAERVSPTLPASAPPRALETGTLEGQGASTLDVGIRDPEIARRLGLDLAPRMDGDRGLALDGLAARLGEALVLADGGEGAEAIRRAYRRLLVTGEVVEDTTNPEHGWNESRILELREGEISGEGLFKPAAGEVETGIDTGEQYLREVTVSELSDLSKAYAVPLTIARSVDGKGEGSLQAFIPGAVAIEKTPAPLKAEYQLDRAASERLRAFDYVCGNADRGYDPDQVDGKNLLIVAVDGEGKIRPLGRETSVAEAAAKGWKLYPIGIDNGQALPVLAHSWGLPAPRAWIQTHTGPLLGETRAFIDGLSRHAWAEVLARGGYSEDHAVGALRRMARLKKDPTFLEIEAPGGLDATMRMLQRMKAAAQDETQGLSESELLEIDRVVAEAFRRTPTYDGTRARYYAVESVSLAALGGTDRVWLKRKPHEGWPTTVPPERSLQELADKVRFQVGRLYDTDRPKLARYYAMQALRTLRLGVEIPGPRGITDYGAHYAWARNSATRDELIDEIAARFGIGYAASR